ncbi:DUF6603 domain-containing protein [uncultured Roseobacter sp.]|uniref:DUF6603 domain-containing protein n=1 Tax=uncultured Roseobacter sp. TaxID=114847 RepID=UPI0026381437|nr:DUF6603 domain-containing protein [uncultured Roseobacter sp.]
MNAFSPDEFGDTSDLLSALGLVDEDGNFNSDWLANPETYLKSILANDHQREALLAFVTAIRGGEAERDSENRLWVEIFAEALPGTGRIAFFLVVDDAPSSEVHISVGVRFETQAPLTASRSALMFPLFRAGKGDNSPSPELVGQPGGVITLSSEITVSETPAPPGQAGLQAVGLRLVVPTDTVDGAPQVGLTLRGLQLPGESTGRDLVLSVTEPDSLKEAGLELIFGLLQAQLGNSGGAQIRAFAKMLGLGNDPDIPTLPVEDIFTRGLDALADWFAALLGDTVTRTAWLQALAELLDNGATVDDGTVVLPIGSASLRLGLSAPAGATGRPIVTVSAGFGFDSAEADIGITADLVRIDLGTGNAVAVPSIRAEASIDLSGLSIPDVSVDRLVLGFGLNEDRYPVLLLELRQATIFSSTHPRLDLTNPDALAATASQAVTDALAEVIGDLGPAGNLIGIVLGWDAPPGAGAGYPRIELLEFLGDPIGLLRAHWNDVLTSHSGDIPALLAVLRELLTGDATPGAVTGSGSETDPWQLPLDAGLHVAVWRDNGGRLLLGLGLLRRVDTLGERCTVIETRLRVALVAFDLTAGAAGFLPEILVRALGRARGGGRLSSGSGALRLEVDHVGVVMRWTPDGGLGIDHEAPNLALFVDDLDVPLPVPDLSGGFEGLLDRFSDTHWDAIERLISLVARRVGVTWLNDLVDALGWKRTAPVLGNPRRHRLRLAALISDTETALRSWLADLLADGQQQIARHLQPLARVLSSRPDGNFHVEGNGTICDPWRVTLAAGAGIPAIAVWRQPDAPVPFPEFLASTPLRRWRPGVPGLNPGKLADAILSEFPDLAGPFRDGPDASQLISALTDLVGRWTGSDGFVRPPAVAVSGTTLHLTPNESAEALFSGASLEEILGSVPATRINIRVLPVTASVDVPGDVARVLDMREAGRDPLAFTPLPDQAGEWTILLAPRADARLPAGDVDGTQGQTQRLQHALSLIRNRPDAVIVSDAAAGHAAWQALQALGSGINRLVSTGLVTSPAQIPPPLPVRAQEIIRRLAEFLPDPDPAEPDDPDLAAARELLTAALSADAPSAADLALPAGWTGARRGDLAVHLVYGVYDGDAVRRALTAAIAAGLSLNALARSAARETEAITSASLGLWLPLSTAAAVPGLQVRGHALAEIIGLDIDLAGDIPDVSPRSARAIAVAAELRHSSGWLIGGPAAAPRPLDLELRSVEIDLQLTIGASPEAALNRVAVILHGVRIHGRSFPRLKLSPDTSEADLGIDGLAAPGTPEIRQLMNAVINQIRATADPAVTRITQALRAAGIIGPGETFDAIALSNWMDDPAGRLNDVLTTPELRTQLMALIGGVLGEHAGLSFDPARRELTVGVGATTGLPFPGEWALAATLGPAGVSSAEMRLGAIDDTHVSLGLAPFSATMHVTPATAESLGGLPATVPLWPAPDIRRLGEAALPALIATAVARMLDGVRASDPRVRPVVDAVLNAIGLVDGDAVRLPPQLFIRPGSWFLSHSNLALSDGSAFRPDRVVALLDALKPLVGLTGGPGVWDITPGLSLRARDAGGLLLDLSLDPALFMPSADVDFGGSVGLTFTPDGRVLPALAVFAGLTGGTPGTRAIHLTVNGPDVVLFLRTGAASDLEIFPNPGSLAQLATAGVSAALPLALDAIVDTGSDIGLLLADVGDTLLLRQGGSFDGPRLVAWATDPAGSLETQWQPLLVSGLSRLGDVLPPALGITRPANAVRLEISDAGTPGSVFAVQLTHSPLSVELSALLVDIPFANTIAATIQFDTATIENGLARLNATVGPAQIPLSEGVVLRPVFEIDVGQAVATPFVSIGLAVDGTNSQALALQYDFNAQRLAPDFGGGSDAEIAQGIVTFAVDMLGAFLMELSEINDVLDEPLAGTTIRTLMRGVALNDAGTGLNTELFRVVKRSGESDDDFLQTKFDRVIRLLNNIADANPTLRVGGVLDIGLARSGGALGFSLGLAGRLPVVEGDIAIWIENDSRWIIGGPSAGLKIGLLSIGPGTVSFTPTLSVDGVGLRIGRSNAPLLDSPIALGSIALHIFARLSQSEKLGGAQLQLSEIAVAVGGAGGGSESNPVAEGMLSETNEGDATLAPSFSPAISVQTRPAADGGGIAFGFVAGDGDGPWWLPIRSQFGPIYVDQIGMGTQVANDELQSISLLFDGNVSIAGLTAAVDDLELRYRLDQGGIFDASSWAVDLAGLAVSADISSVTLAGGLRKFGTPPNLEYVGMLTARFATYGLSIYGGYASIETPEKFSAFFAYGAVLGPFGGPPAFFLTGIGGGFGINRDIVPPADLGQFDEFVMIQALDPAATLPDDLMDYMQEIRDTFPPAKGKFWFAAGISFTSFALVDGIAVVAVEFGQGFELSIFGLARMALPRPQVALVSIELGLIARFSTEEGVIWIQAQLTDNSWLLHPSARLTGGFAYVSWFKGDKAGQFVLTLGGYHPNFHRDGYPVVPRLGFNWSVSNNIVVKSESYFALTSEAIMAGGLFEASAKFGPAFAHLSFGGNAIVYFDPFSYMADAHARVSAGIRIKTIFGTIKLSFSLGAYIEVFGPEFHGNARIEVGPIDIRVRFGNSNDASTVHVSWAQFAAKYLELAENSQTRARALSGIAGKGSLPPAGDASGAEKGTADGTSGHPYDVMSEFELSFTSTVPLTAIRRENASVSISLPTPTLGVCPAGKMLNGTTLRLELRRDGSGTPRLGDTVKIKVTPRETGNFPLGVWGPPQLPDDRKMPKGDVIPATEGVDLKFQPELIGRIPLASTGGVAFNQVESGVRKPLPLRAGGTIRSRMVREAKEQRELLSSLDPEVLPEVASDWHQGGRSATARRAWHRERPVPMRIGLLSERIVGSSRTGRKDLFRELGPRPSKRFSFGKARLRGLLHQPLRVMPRDFAAEGTRVTKELGDLRRMAPPGIAANIPDRAVLLRTRVETPVIRQTIAARQVAPETLPAHGPVAMVRGRGTAADLAGIAAVEAMISGPARGSARRRSTARTADAPAALTTGQIAVFDLPGAVNAALFKTAGDVALSGPARVATIGLDGRITTNRTGASRLTLPAATRAFVLLAGEAETAAPEIAGWLDTTQLAYLGQSMARCRGGFLRAEGASRTRGGRRAGCGWLEARDMVAHSGLIETQFDTGADTVALILNGTVRDEDLETLAISYDNAEAADDKPRLVPFDGKTLLVQRIRTDERRKPFSVSVAGLVGDRIDGTLAARLPEDTLVSRLLNTAVQLDLEAISDEKASPVTATWTPPDDVEA